MEEITMYITRPSLENWPEPKEGYEQTTCELCGRAVWKRPIEEEIKKHPQYSQYTPVFVCTICALKQANPNGQQ